MQKMNNEKFGYKMQKNCWRYNKRKIIVSEQPINFLAMVNIKTGKITDKNHKLNNQTLKKTSLSFLMPLEVVLEHIQYFH